ncbi:MAG: polyhydroxyalkanoate synthesis regulator DNA-binding domain-containing protein [Bdellovibrionales bacterium]
MDRKTFQTNQESKSNRPKIIKKYGNRKLYDTEKSSYVVLKDIEKMIRNEEEIRVIDNETQDDITIPTLTQIIFGAEKKSNVSAPLDILKSIIKEGDGGFSSFLSKLGLFKAENNLKPSEKSDSIKEALGTSKKKRSGFSSENVEEKLASLITSDETRVSSSDSVIPHLPGSGLNNE